jgi:hypothetical protein
MKIGLSILVLSLCLSLSIASSVSQLGPFVQVPTNIAAGSLATATILPVSLAAGSPPLCVKLLNISSGCS